MVRIQAYTEPPKTSYTMRYNSSIPKWVHQCIHEYITVGHLKLSKHKMSAQLCLPNSLRRPVKGLTELHINYKTYPYRHPPPVLSSTPLSPLPPFNPPAFSPSDVLAYTAVSRYFIFSFSSRQQCVDFFLNVYKPFSVTIDTSANRIVLDPYFTAVLIVDNDGEWKGGREVRRKEGKIGEDKAMEGGEMKRGIQEAT